MKPTTKNSSLTSFWGVTFYASVNDLLSIFGDPVSVSNDGKNKVNYVWEMETNSGHVFTVYDWKYYRTLAPDETVTWNIGGRDETSTGTALREILEAMRAFKKVVMYVDGKKTPSLGNWLVMRDYDEFEGTVTVHGLENIRMISFGYVLDDKNGRTGLDCAQWLIDHYQSRVESEGIDIQFPETSAHSTSPSEYMGIISCINAFLRSKGLPETCKKSRIIHHLK